MVAKRWRRKRSKTNCTNERGGRANACCSVEAGGIEEGGIEDDGVEDDGVEEDDVVDEAVACMKVNPYLFSS
jgi:hypothetical protein